MTNRKTLDPLLLKIVSDHYTFKFPLNDLRGDLTGLFFGQKFFQDHLFHINRKLKKNYNELVSRVFVVICDRYFSTAKNVNRMSQNEYWDLIEGFIEVLEMVRITQVPKNSPDGEILKEIHP